MYTKCERQQCTGVSAEVNGHARTRTRTPMFTSIAESEREPVVADVLLLLYICVSQTYVSTGKAASSTVS